MVQLESKLNAHQEGDLELLHGVRRLLQGYAVRCRRVNVHLSGFMLRVHNPAAREWQHHIVDAIKACAVAVLRY